MKAEHWALRFYQPQRQSVLKRAEAPVWTVSHSCEIVFPIGQGGLIGKNTHG